MDNEDAVITSYLVGILLAVLTCLMDAIANVATRRLKSVHFIVIQYHYATIATIINFIWIIVVISDSDGPKVF